MNLYLLGYIAEHVRRDETGGQCQKDAESAWHQQPLVRL